MVMAGQLQANTPREPSQLRQEAALDEHKRSFLRMVGHELRTPLNSILGFSEILSSELYGPLGDSRYKQYAAIIHDSGEKLLRLVDQLLEIARLQSGDYQLNLKMEPVRPALDDLTGGIGQELASRDLRITLCDCDEAAVVADARALRKVLGALLENAVTHSPDGGEIRVRTRRLAGQLDIAVENQGEGVAAAELARLVQAFEQGENPLTRHAEGAGLGLAICHLTCEAMGGRLRLESTPGQGFSAHVILPTP